VISHWDDVESVRREKGHIAATWQSLTGEDSLWIGVRRVRIEPDRWATPLHLEGSDEEIFYVLSGEGVSVQRDDSAAGDQAYAVGAGDCLVHRALEHAHTLGAGPAGLEVLAFGERSYAANTLLPRAGVSWLGPTWVLQGAPDDHPWAREAAAGPPATDVLSERPGRIVNVESVSPFERRSASVGSWARPLGRAAGALKTGLSLYDVEAGMLLNPPHAHSEEEEIYVVIGGGGMLDVWPHPRAQTEPGWWPGEHEHRPLRVGSTVAARAGTGRPLSLRAGADGMRVLAFSQDKPNDICFYPRSGKISFRGVGVIGRLEQLPYWEGED
jgi:uncharacterized cupin superfamily protein